MRIRKFQSEQWFPREREELFAFFSDVSNLDTITPPWVRFQTVTTAPITMARGTLIDHKLRIHGIPIRWQTEIKLWQPTVRFVDEQVRGPYRVWIHEHTFEEQDGGTLMRDYVRYAVPFDLLVHRFLVRPDVEQIFAYRAEMLGRKFGHPDESGAEGLTAAAEG